MKISIIDDALDVEKFECNSMLNLFHKLVNISLCILFNQVLNFGADCLLVIICRVLAHIALSNVGYHVFNLRLVS